MTEAIVNYLFRLPRMILLLALSALACLPVALSKIVRDASLGLWLPLTLLGMLLACALSRWHVRKISTLIILLLLGPFSLFIYIGQLGRPIFELIKQTLAFIPPLIDWLRYRIPCDPFGFVLASSDLTQRILALGSRLFLWFSGLRQGAQVEDPLARILIWSMSLWLIAVWSGWQVYQNKRVLEGMLPATILMALILDYTGKEIWILWLHLSLLLLVYGLSSYTKLRERWDLSRIDYSESTSTDTLALVGALTLSLMVLSSFAANISIKDILDHWRERHSSSNEARTESLGLAPAKENQTVSGSNNSLYLSDYHAVGPGPDLSDQLVMTVSTGDLPPMPPNAHPFVRNYYWRTMTYENYTGSGWSNPSPFEEDVPPNKILVEPPYPKYRLVKQEITFPNQTSENMYWTGTLLSSESPFKALWIRRSEKDPLLESDMLAALAPVKSYRAESLVLEVSAQDLRDSPSVYPDWVRNRFLRLPDSVPQRVRSLGRDLSASGRTAYDRAIAIQNYLREFPYTLDVPGPPPGRDVADFFLFDLKKGYCDYYATTMVVLARAAGLPARIVMGFASGSYDVEQARYFVAENNAHAWVEIYFTGIGWVEFEPTASQPAIVYPEKISSDRPAQTSDSRPATDNQLVFVINHAFSFVWIPAIIFFILALLGIWWDSARLTRLEPVLSIQLIYRRLRRLARPISGLTAKHQTAHAYSFVLKERLSSLATEARLQNWLLPSREEINQLTELYSRCLFASASPTYMDARRAIKVWARLRLRLLLANGIAIKNQWLKAILPQRA